MPGKKPNGATIYAPVRLANGLTGGIGWNKMENTPDPCCLPPRVREPGIPAIIPKGRHCARASGAPPGFEVKAQHVVLRQFAHLVFEAIGIRMTIFRKTRQQALIHAGVARGR